MQEIWDASPWKRRKARNNPNGCLKGGRFFIGKVVAMNIAPQSTGCRFEPLKSLNRITRTQLLGSFADRRRENCDNENCDHDANIGMEEFAGLEAAGE
ncbi:hypothetical protein [Paenibacillus glycinis]|uniref:hypothetical protein n=1 Tax=Paenibacillus glycinis TaxID=2697035 RepID=UPI00191BF524|nr:hypothetical protein [Paenibacillus glycinis]